jgi:hypothetical protein
MSRITQTRLLFPVRILLVLVTLFVPLSFMQPALAATAGCDSASSTTCKPTDPAATSGNCSSVAQCDLISNYINPAIAFLSALVGVAVVASMVIGGIQYSSSGGDPSKAAAAKNRIRNSLIALIVFIFLFALLNFLIPGGLL